MDAEKDLIRKNHAPQTRPDLNTWIFGLIIMLAVESCALGVVVLIWMAANGYLW